MVRIKGHDFKHQPKGDVSLPRLVPRSQGDGEGAD